MLFRGKPMILSIILMMGRRESLSAKISMRTLLAIEVIISLSNKKTSITPSGQGTRPQTGTTHTTATTLDRNSSTSAALQ